MKANILLSLIITLIEEYLLNGQILCYLIIGLLGEEKSHEGNGNNFLHDNLVDMVTNCVHILLQGKEH